MCNVLSWMDSLKVVPWITLWLWLADCGTLTVCSVVNEWKVREPAVSYTYLYFTYSGNTLLFPVNKDSSSPSLNHSKVSSTDKLNKADCFTARQGLPLCCPDKRSVIFFVVLGSAVSAGARQFPAGPSVTEDARTRARHKRQRYEY